MADEVKKRKPGNPNFSTGKPNPYRNNARDGRWKRDEPNKLVGIEPELVGNREVKPDQLPPEAA